MHAGALILPYQGVTPTLANDVFIAPGAAVVGKVTIGQGSNVWYNVTIRGDVHTISIGEMTNIQDGSVCHVTYKKFGLTVGNRVTVGHNAILHACEIGDDCLIGMGSTVMDGAVVESGAMVAAGALVTPGKVVKSGELWTGSPARSARPMTDEEKAYVAWSAEHYYKLGQEHKQAQNAAQGL